MKRLIVILAAAGFASVAGAQQPTEVEQSLEPDAAAVAVGTEASDAPVSDRNCLRHTGSHIPASENAKARRAGKPPEQCANAFARAYDRAAHERDRKSVVQGKSVSVRGNHGGRPSH